MFLNNIGIVGWESIEPALISAIAMDISVMLEGEHQTCKTTGSERIAKAVFGDDINFVSYDVPNLNVDDMLGYLNPKKMADGVLEYIKTPTCIWNVDACLLDEYNKGSLFVQNKLLELTRQRTVHGTKTKLKLVLAAVNPPGQTDAAYMDHPKSSRFVILHVPGFQDLDPEHRLAIIEHDALLDTWQPEGIRKVVQDIKDFDLTNWDQVANIVTFTNKLVGALRDIGVRYQTGQAVRLCKLLIGINLYAQITGEPLNDEHVQIAVCATIPEVTGLVRTAVQSETIRQKVAEMVMLGAFQDVLKLNELLVTDPDEYLPWLGMVNRAIPRAEVPVLVNLFDKLLEYVNKNRFRDDEKDAITKTRALIASRIYCVDQANAIPNLDTLFGLHQPQLVESYINTKRGTI